MISNVAYFVAGAHVICQAFCAETRCRKVARKGMAALFQSIDLDDVGSLSRDRWNEVFAQADCNRNGLVSRGEWREAFGSLAAFDFIDQNGNGMLEHAEWDDAFVRFDKEKQGSITAADMQIAVEDQRIDLQIGRAHV